MKRKFEKGITLIALVITIIILVIIAGVSINLLLGNKGIIEKAKYASNETTKEAAKEAMNLKITNIQISSYTENQELPNLQYLADKLCEDNDMEYVLTQSKANASLDKIDVTNLSSIYTKLKEYPYEFEINSSLQLASIDGIKVANNTTEEIESLKNQIKLLEEKNKKLTEEIENYSNLNIELYDQQNSSYKAWSGASHNLTLSSELEKGKYIIILNGSRSNQSNGNITSGTLIFSEENAIELSNHEYNDSIISNDGAQLLMLSKSYLLDVSENITINSTFTANYAMNMNFLMTILKIN